MGTPHRESQFDSWESIVAKLVLKGGRGGNCSLSDVIQRSAPVLRDVSRRFEAISALFTLISFYEAYGLSDTLVGATFTAHDKRRLISILYVEIRPRHCHHGITQ